MTLRLIAEMAGDERQEEESKENSSSSADASEQDSSPQGDSIHEATEGATEGEDTGHNLPTESQETEEKVASFDDDESEESRFIPDIDDYSRDPDDLESEISLVLLEEVKTIQELETTTEGISKEKIDAVVKFASVCKTQGIEVLKLNRRNKWQARFLTVSSETFPLNQVKDLREYPQALLWAKRFSAKEKYSLGAISSEGRGGVEFSKIESLTFENSENLPHRSFPKFKNSVQVNLHYWCGEESRSLAIRFVDEAAADFFASSMESIMDVLDSEGDLT